MGTVTRLACALLVAVAHPVLADAPSPQQKVALTDRPSVVRIWGAYIGTFTLDNRTFTEGIGGTGSGFFITPDGYIATNAHVVLEIHGGDEAAKKALFDKLLADLDKKYASELAKMTDAELHHVVESIKLTKLEKRAYAVLPNGDHLDYEIKLFGKPGTGRDCAIVKVKVQNAPTLPIGDSSKMQIADPIVVIGFPGVADFQELLDEKSQLEATVTEGSVSSLKRASTGEPILQISAPITHGNSGGPAIDQHGNVIGLATFGNEDSIQGFNFLVASATLGEMAKEAKIEPKASATNTAWRTGLDHYWADEYTAAVHAFEQVETLFPQHAEAPRLIRLSHQAQKDGKEKQPSNNAGLIAGFAVGGGILVGGLGFVFLRRRRPMPRPHMPYAMTPPHQPPPPQMYGRDPNQAGGIAPTAFGSMSIGSLTCTRGPLLGQRFALTPGGIIVGRQPGVAHVLVNDHRASGKHVWVGFDQGRLVAIDQGTTNGTYVNDVMRGRITRIELNDGDIIIVGEPDCCSLQVRLG